MLWLCYFFFFKQKTAYEMRISDWSSDVCSSDLFGYFGSAYGISFLAPLGISTDADPSAAHVGQLIKQMRAEHIKALFIENMTDPRLVQQLAREAHAVVGGTLYSDSLSKAGGPADTYVDRKSTRLNSSH